MDSITKIKHDVYECGGCKSTDYSVAWNVFTKEKYGSYNGGITPIEEEAYGSFFVCPSCGVECEWGDYNEDDEEVTITKKRYDELLEIEAMYNDLRR
jgi:hypothetical protein